ncbi:MAG: hypothetical protein HQL31_02225 [Planctomycetes bacterium]|nr:hypothetical protein [Planctomycetota bacterium]
MKDQYVGDINDYRKYGLLRALKATSGLHLTVCWMLTPGDGGSDGRKLRYLSQEDLFSRYDPALFSALRNLVAVQDLRSVSAIERSGILPNTVFHSDILTDNPGERAAYFRELDKLASGSDMVFFDPDNGLEVKSVQYGRKNSSKYLYLSECANTFGQGKSVLVYQHFPRQDRQSFISEVSEKLQDACKGAKVLAFTTPHVAFFLAAQPAQWGRLQAAAGVVKERWRGEIEVSG